MSCHRHHIACIPDSETASNLHDQKLCIVLSPTMLLVFCVPAALSMSSMFCSSYLLQTLMSSSSKRAFWRLIRSSTLSLISYTYSIQAADQVSSYSFTPTRQLPMQAG